MGSSVLAKARAIVPRGNKTNLSWFDRLERTPEGRKQAKIVRELGLAWIRGEITAGLPTIQALADFIREELSLTVVRTTLDRYLKGLKHEEAVTARESRRPARSRNAQTGRKRR